MPRSFLYHFLFIAAILLAGCTSADDQRRQGSSEAGYSTSAGESSKYRNLEPGVGFVGDDACFNCHENEYRGFKNHGMANSMYPLTDETAVETFGSEVVTDSRSGLRYSTFTKDGKYFMEEYLEAPSGEHEHSLVREIRFVIGSGTSARTYLTENSGWFYEMPITWYTQKKKWDFSPGYSLANKRFVRKAGDRCIACHNSYPKADTFTNGRYQEMPSGIGCERCHGPGELHVEERLATPEPADSLDDTIVNPAHLSLDRRLDVCQQCHLNGSVSLLRDGRTAYDFRPSEVLGDFVSIFAKDEEFSEDEIGVISHADRMKQSVCFLATQSLDEPLECTTCHDPHTGFRDQGSEYFNATCRSCHDGGQLRAGFAEEESSSSHSDDANCIACHMPKRDLIEAPHSSFTDHWIRVVKEEGVSTSPVPAHERTKLIPYFERDRFDDGVVYEGMAYVIWGRQQQDTASLQKGIEILSAVPEESRFGEASFLLGYAQAFLGRDAEAVSNLEVAVQKNADIPERLNALAKSYENVGGDADRIEQLYRRALELQPALADVQNNYGRFLETRNRLDEAMAAYRSGIEAEPWSPLPHYNLATAYLRNKQLEEAETEFRKALELDPFYAPAWSNLGLIFMARGEYDRGREAFERGIKADPGHPESLANLGTYYLNIDDLTNAIPILVRAVRAAPKNAEYMAKLALASFRDDDFEQAREYAGLAIKLDPENKLALQVLGAL